MKRSIIFPNIVTAFSLACGLFIIFKLSLLPKAQVSYDEILASVLILLLAAFLDLLDGAIARAMKVVSDFGRVFDSLADTVSFGVAPSVIVLKALSVEPKTAISFFLILGAMIYSISGVLRLVRFTVTSKKQGLEDTKDVQVNFTGLPIPVAAVLVVSTTLFLMTPEAQMLFSFTHLDRVWIATTVFFVLGYFMVSRWKFPSIKNLHRRVSFFQVVLISALVTVVVLFFALQYFALLLALVSWTYILIAWVLSLLRIIAGKRLKALESYEPEEEEEGEEEL